MTRMMNTSAVGDRRRRAAARGTPGAATRTGRRPRTCSRPAACMLVEHACWTSATALPRSRPSRRAVTSAICRRFSRMQLGLAVARRSIVASAEAGDELAVRAADRRLRRAGRGSKRYGVRDSARAPESCGRAGAGRSRRRRARRRDELRRRPARPSGRGAPAADRIDLPGDLGAAALHADDVDDAVESSRASLDLLGQLARALA